MQNLPGKVAFITGGGSEAGISIARALGKAGAKIALADSVDERLAAACSLLAAEDVDAMTMRADVANQEDMHRAAEAVVARFGKVHILVGCAERGSPGRLSDLGEQEWDDAFGVNIGGIVNLIQEFLPIVLSQNEGGHILARATFAGVVGGGSSGGDAVQSSAVVAIMEALAAELPRRGVGASLVFVPPSGSGEATAIAELGSRVVQGIGADDLYIFGEIGDAGAIRGYFAPLLAAMPASTGQDAGPVGHDEMFPYAAVLRAKAAHIL